MSETRFDRSIARFAPDRNLSVRMMSVMFLLTAVYGAAIVALVLLLGRSWPLGVAVLVGFAAFQLMTSSKVAMRVMGAHEVAAEQEPELHAVVDRLCAMADMRKPAVAIAESDVPNAFAVGRSKQATALCVTRGLLRRLDNTELEAVIAHELSHVAHGDAAVMTVASFLGVLAGLVARVGVKLIYFGSRARGLWHLIVAAMGVMVLAGATWFISLVLTRSLSRYREFAADRSAAQLTGNPSALASALTKVSDAVSGGGGIPMKDLRNASALNAFFFAPVSAASKSAREKTHHLLSTHPTTQARLDRLAKMTGDLTTRN
jgi:heat shock protein HtpX